jgi:hypothetical protein
MTDKAPKTDLKPLIQAAIAEGLCLVAGIAAWMGTGKIIWLFIGIVGGAAFSLPAIIEFIKQNKGEG